MKIIKLLSALAVCLAGFAFTSCNTGSSDNETWTPLTQAEKTHCYNATAGLHASKMIYLSDEHQYKDNDYQDTVDVNFRIYTNITKNDTTLLVQGFPVRVLARYIPESSSTNDLKTALKAYTETVEFDGRVDYIKTSPITFIMNPRVLSVNLEYGGATHKVDFYCYASSIWSAPNYGILNATTSKLGVQFCVMGYKVDANDSDKNDPTSFNYYIGGQNMKYGIFTMWEK